jgi:hypothetical protein
MKKIFTLVAMALVAVGVNAQDIKDIDPTHLYPIKSITWGPITWEVKNSQVNDLVDPIYIVLGQGNAYETIMAEEIYTDEQPTGKYRAAYGYLDYEGGKTGIPGYGLYYKFTPKTAGTLKVTVFANKGGRKTFVVKGSTGTPLTPYVDYKVEGYVNGQKGDDGKLKFFTNEEVKARHDAKGANTYVIDEGSSHFWGYISFSVEPNESYYIFQASSQIGFGGFEFGTDSYVSAPGGVMAEEFSKGVNNEKGQVVTITKDNIIVEAQGSSTPTEVVPDRDTDGIATVKAATLNANAPMYNLAGQQVDAAFTGMVIQNGKKFVNK